MHRGEKIDYLLRHREDYRACSPDAPWMARDPTGIRALDEVPQTFLTMSHSLKRPVGVLVTLLSVGPDREKTSPQMAQPVG